MLLVDTGVFLAAADRREAQYAACVEVLSSHRGDLAATTPVVAESAWLIERRLGVPAEAAFLRLVTTGEVRVVDLSIDDYERCVELVVQMRMWWSAARTMTWVRAWVRPMPM